MLSCNTCLFGAAACALRQPAQQPNKPNAAFQAACTPQCISDGLGQFIDCALGPVSGPAKTLVQALTGVACTQTTQGEYCGTLVLGARNSRLEDHSFIISMCRRGGHPADHCEELRVGATTAVLQHDVHVDADGTGPADWLLLLLRI